MGSVFQCFTDHTQLFRVNLDTEVVVRSQLELIDNECCRWASQPPTAYEDTSEDDSFPYLKSPFSRYISFLEERTSAKLQSIFQFVLN
jgi:hypothetical protein